MGKQSYEKTGHYNSSKKEMVDRKNKLHFTLLAMVNQFITSSTQPGFVSQIETVLSIGFLLGRLVYNLHFPQLYIEAVCLFSCFGTQILLKRPFVYRLPWQKVSRVYIAVHNLIKLESFPTAQGMCSSVVVLASCDCSTVV